MLAATALVAEEVVVAEEEGAVVEEEARIYLHDEALEPLYHRLLTRLLVGPRTKIACCFWVLVLAVLVTGPRSERSSLSLAIHLR